MKLTLKDAIDSLRQDMESQRSHYTDVERIKDSEDRWKRVQELQRKLEEKGEKLA